MSKRGASKVIEVMILIIIGVVVLGIVSIFVNVQIKNQGEVSEIKNKMLTEEMEILSVKGNMENPTIVSLQLSRGAGQQTVIGENTTEVNYTSYNITTETHAENVTVAVYGENITEPIYGENITKPIIENVSVPIIENISVPIIENISVPIIGNVTVPIIENISVPIIGNVSVPIIQNVTVPITQNVSVANHDILFVSDLSGSMYMAGYEDKLTPSKAAHNTSIDILLNVTNISVGMVGYRSSACTYSFDCQTLTSSKSQLFSKVNYWSAGGGTCICCGINKAADYLINSPNTGRQKVMIVMSDGQPTSYCATPGTYIGSGDGNNEDPIDINTAFDAARTAASKGITIHTVGFGSNIDESVLENISIIGNGQYSFANVNNIAEVYTRIIEETITQEIEQIIGYTTEEQITGYKTEENITGYRTEENITGYRTEENITGYRKEQNITGYKTEENITGYNITEIITGYNITETILGYHQVPNITYITVEQNVTSPVSVVTQQYSGASTFTYLKIVFTNSTGTLIQTADYSQLPGPLDSGDIVLDLQNNISNIQKIEIYPITLSSDGKEIAGSLLSTWTPSGDINYDTW
jgi:hypothetical protein